jgi:hypothetical protein
MAFDNPLGLQLIGDIGDYHHEYYTVTNAVTVYIGDAVSQTGTAGTVKRYAAGDVYVGCCMSYIEGDGTLKALVVDDPNAHFYIQCDDTASAAVAATDVLDAFNLIVPAAPAAGIRYSNMELDISASAAAGAFILLGINEGAEPSGGVLPTYAATLAEAKVRPNLARTIFWQP